MKKIFSVLLVIAALMPSLFVSGCTQKGGHTDELREFEVSPSQLFEKLETEKIKLLDVREQNEYDESHIKDTLLLSVNNLTQEKLDSLNLKKDDEIIVYCRSGKRSEKAYNILKSLGYENVKSLGGGIIHWEEEGYPVEKGSSIKDKNNFLFLDREEHDFGEIPQYGGIVSTEFMLSNPGSDTARIEQITTSCSCTTAEADSLEIPPGGRVKIMVSFDPNLHAEPAGRFKRTVFIDTDAGEIEATVWADILEGV